LTKLEGRKKHENTWENEKNRKRGEGLQDSHTARETYMKVIAFKKEIRRCDLIFLISSR
jgi:hypothetical protein